jgi:hypothetical protein
MLIRNGRTRPLEALMIGGWVRAAKRPGHREPGHRAGAGPDLQEHMGQITKELRAGYQAFRASCLGGVQLLVLFVAATGATRRHTTGWDPTPPVAPTELQRAGSQPAVAGPVQRAGWPRQGRSPLWAPEAAAYYNARPTALRESKRSKSRSNLAGRVRASPGPRWSAPGRRPGRRFPSELGWAYRPRERGPAKCEERRERVALGRAHRMLTGSRGWGRLLWLLSRRKGSRRSSIKSSR